MAYKYKNILNMQGCESTIREVLQTIQHPDFGLGSIDFDSITPIPLWAYRNDTMRATWMQEHWGVGENASGLAESVETYDGGETIEFNTVGSPVRELMQKLSLMFPKLTDLAADYLWASEDAGKDSGMVQYRSGEQVYEYIPEPDSMEAYELCFDLHSTEPEDHGLVFDDALGTYRYGGNLLKQEAEHDGGAQ